MLAESSIITDNESLFVEDLSFDLRLEKVQRELECANIHIERVSPFYEDWDYTMHHPKGMEKLRYISVGNVHFRVLTWQPNRVVTTDEVHKHFMELEADGNTAALLTMLGTKRFIGQYVSIPQDNTLLRYTRRQGVYYAPYFKLIDKNCIIGLYKVNPVWKYLRYAPWIFVGFQKISAP